MDTNEGNFRHAAVRMRTAAMWQERSEWQGLGLHRGRTVAALRGPEATLYTREVEVGWDVWAPPGSVWESLFGAAVG